MTVVALTTFTHYGDVHVYVELSKILRTKYPVGEPDPRTNDCRRGVGETKRTYPIKSRESVPVAAGDCLSVPAGLALTCEGGSRQPEPGHAANVSETSQIRSLANEGSPWWTRVDAMTAHRRASDYWRESRKTVGKVNL
jgi:hypothetical protein